MDKYTVDLDKVLNDFEYKELTEQSQPAPYTYGARAYDPAETQVACPRLPLPTTKHSINNVFHSLNEYLNSGIKGTPSGSFDDEAPTPEPEPPVLLRKSSADTNTIQQIFKNLTKETTAEIFKDVTTESVCDSSEQPAGTEPPQQVQPPPIIDAAKVPNGTERAGIEGAELEEATAVTWHPVETHPELDSNVENNVPVRIVGFEEITDLSDSEMNKELELLEAELAEQQDDDDESDEDAAATLEKDLKSELEEANNNNNNNNTSHKIVEFISCETNEMKPEASIISTQTNGNATDVIQTSNLVYVTDESVVTNEEERTQKVHEIEQAPEMPVQTVDINETNLIIADETEKRPSELEQVHNGEVQVWNSPAEADTEEEEEQQQQLQQQDVEVRVNDVSVDQEDESSEYSAERGVERRSAATLVRPSSLELNSDTGSDNVTIDLIGDPGSTPYNNVYIQNKLQTEKRTQKGELLDADVEPTNSLSPTLSDASTIDNSDSANTSDSCNDTSLDEYCDEKPARSAADPAANTITTTTTTTTITSTASNQAAATSDEQPAPGGVSQAAALQLGQTAPFWIPDSEAQVCQHCGQRFMVIRRRHHCRACGLVLCAGCCHHKYPIPYLGGTEARVCLRCLRVLQQLTEAGAAANNNGPHTPPTAPQLAQSGSSGSANSSPEGGCAAPAQPAGVLKRTGSTKTRHSKSVTFCDGVRPGHDDNSTATATATTKLSGSTGRTMVRPAADHHHYIPAGADQLPPLVTSNHPPAEVVGSGASAPSHAEVVQLMRDSEVRFALRLNLFVRARIINMECCINKMAWCFATDGMIAVGQDELVVLLELMDDEREVPKHIFYHFDNIYNDALKGTSITEMGLSVHDTSNFLGSKNHVGFLYIKPTFQCIQNVLIPKEPYLIGILIHRWETPWAKIFPLRLLLRLGAEYRYYPSPIISTRHRESVYVEIGHTIINLLADFRNFSYTIPAVRGLTIHMEGQNTTVSIPMNRYDQVMKALNNSSDHILAFAGNFSPKADSYLVCIQDTHGSNENSYSTHAINIHNRPRQVTGASFIVLNGALKSSSGLTAKSSIVEDGLMIQILGEQMVKLRNSLRNMKDFKISCGCLNAQSDECVNLVWTDNDVNFNVGVTSTIDGASFSGVPSIRVHNGKDYVCNGGTKLIRWTEVFIIQSGEECPRSQDPIDTSKLSESIAKATGQALVTYLDLLAANNFMKIGIRATLHVDNVSYLAGSNNTRLPPIYMKSLDNELVPVLHHILTGNASTLETAIVLELVFHILNA